MSELGKPFQESQIKNKIKAKMPHEKKTASKKGKFGSNEKLGLERTMNGLGKAFKEKTDPKNPKKKQ